MAFTVKGVGFKGSTTLRISPVHNITQDTYYDSIAWAVYYANPNDVIEVRAGVYEEQIYINKALTLRGPNYNKAGNDPTRGNEAIIRVNKSMGEYAYVLYPDAANITIEGFTIDCPDSLMQGAGAIFAPYPVTMNAQNNFTFRNNRMYGGEVPLYIIPSGAARSGLLVEGNYIDCGPFVNDSYNRAMYIFNSQGIVQDNVVLNANIGIQFSVQTSIVLSAPSTIRRNTVSASLAGLYNNAMPKGTAAHNWQQNTVTVSPNDRLGLKLLVGGPGAAWGPLAQTNWAAGRVQYMGTEGASSTPPTVTFTNNIFDASRDPAKIYNNVDWFGFSLGLAGGTGNGIAANAVITANNNSVTGWNKAARNITPATGNFANNWWGTTVLTDITSTVVNTGGGTVTIAPILTSGVDSDPATPGFQP